MLESDCTQLCKVSGEEHAKLTEKVKSLEVAAGFQASDMAELGEARASITMTMARSKRQAAASAKLILRIKHLEDAGKSTGKDAEMELVASIRKVAALQTQLSLQRWTSPRPRESI